MEDREGKGLPEQEKREPMNKSVFWLSGGVAILVLFFKLLFGAMYPEDSYRVYQNIEIDEITAENLLEPSTLEGVRSVIDHRQEKELFVQSIDQLLTTSGGDLLAAQIQLMAIDREDRILTYTLTVGMSGNGNENKENSYAAVLVRNEGYREMEIDHRKELIPFDFLFLLKEHPLKELANQFPIANDAYYQMRLPGGREGFARSVSREEIENRQKLKEIPCYFVRKDGGHFQITDPNQISQTAVEVQVLVTEDPSLSGQESYGFFFER